MSVNKQPNIATPKTRSIHKRFPFGYNRRYSRDNRRVFVTNHPMGANWLSFGSFLFTSITIFC